MFQGIAKNNRYQLGNTAIVLGMLKDINLVSLIVDSVRNDEE